MDGTQTPADKRYVLLNKKLADALERLDEDALDFLLSIATDLDCECGCRGLNHANPKTAQ